MNSGVGMGVRRRGFGKGVVHPLAHIATTAQPEMTRVRARRWFILIQSVRPACLCVELARGAAFCSQPRRVCGHGLAPIAEHRMMDASAARVACRRRPNPITKNTGTKKWKTKQF
jgi:hypothetical protein